MTPGAVDAGNGRTRQARMALAGRITSASRFGRLGAGFPDLCQFHEVSDSRKHSARACEDFIRAIQGSPDAEKVGMEMIGDAWPSEIEEYQDEKRAAG